MTPSAELTARLPAIEARVAELQQQLLAAQADRGIAGVQHQLGEGTAEALQAARDREEQLERELRHANQDRDDLRQAIAIAQERETVAERERVIREEIIPSVVSAERHRRALVDALRVVGQALGDFMDSMNAASNAWPRAVVDSGMYTPPDFSRKARGMSIERAEFLAAIRGVLWAHSRGATPPPHDMMPADGWRTWLAGQPPLAAMHVGTWPALLQEFASPELADELRAKLAEAPESTGAKIARRRLGKDAA